MSIKYVSKSEAIAARLLGEEMMVMSVLDSTFYTLDDIATVVWRAADGRTSLSEIVGKICEQYEVDHAQAEGDIEELVDQLSKHGILLVSDTPAPAQPPV